MISNHMFFNFSLFCDNAATVLTAILVPRTVVYCSDLKGLTECFELVGSEQRSDFLKVNLQIIIFIHGTLNYCNLAVNLDPVPDFFSPSRLVWTMGRNP